MKAAILGLKFKLIFSIIFSLGFFVLANGQRKKSFEVSLSGLNQNQDLVWYDEGDVRWYSETALPSFPAFQLELNRSIILGNSKRGFSIMYGPSVLYYQAKYQQPDIDSFFGFVKPPMVVRTTQVYLGLNVGLNKDFNLRKRQRPTMIKPLIRVSLKSYYGVVSNQIMQPINGAPTFKEQITAANNFLLVGEMNVGLKVLFSKNHKSALDIFLPLSMNIKPGSDLSPFYQFGFAGIRYSWAGGRK